MKAKGMKKGQTMVEYILIISLVAIALIAVVRVFTGKVSDKYEEAGDQIESAGNGGETHD